MPVTRSSTRSSVPTVNAASGVFSVQDDQLVQNAEKQGASPRKRKTMPSSAVKSKKSEPDVQTSALGSSPILSHQDASEPEALVPAMLAFDFEEAKRHLIGVDHRFEDLFSKMQCKPFQHLEQVHPFRALATSILAQQISWLAARSITHKFIRLYDPTLPEKPTDGERKAITYFPSPFQVAKTEISVLRTAGLSARKAEYVQDLATRFADGRLSTQKLLEADDDELARMLIEVRGIGRWTVDMFAIFSLRRPDILPVGDLGVQKGMVRWFLSLHSPLHSYSISPEKVGGSATPKKVKKAKADPQEAGEAPSKGEDDEIDLNDAGMSFVPPGTSGNATEVIPALSVFTPSIKNALYKSALTPGRKPAPLPSGIDVSHLKRRLDGKNKVKGAFLMPQEMAALTESWKPYRSLGVYYMWSLAE